MTSENKANAFPLTHKSNNKPLEGVRVIDAGNMVAAPFATVLLADLGADVIKLEHPENGDGQRKLEPITKEGIPLWWKSISRNKRCITLNLGKPEGAEIFTRKRQSRLNKGWQRFKSSSVTSLRRLPVLVSFMNPAKIQVDLGESRIQQQGTQVGFPGCFDISHIGRNIAL